VAAVEHELHVGFVADHHDVAGRELPDDALAVIAAMGAPVDCSDCRGRPRAFAT
jgi:hypothetical protein